MKRGLLLLVLFMSLFVTSLRAQVTAQFSASFLTGCPPLLVNFLDLSTGSPNQWAWNFDGSGTSTLQNPSVSFTNPGLYNVRLIATNTSNGSFDTSFLQIRVFQPPIANFIAPNRYGCLPPCHLVNFVNQSLAGSSPITQYAWDFGVGGGNTSNAFQPNFCYNAVGGYNVTLVVSDSNGCQSSQIRPNYVVVGNDPVAAFTPSATQSCISPLNVTFTNNSTSSTSPLTYNWQFGGGASSTAQSPNHVYFSGIYSPTLIVTDTLGCADTVSANISVTDVNAAFTPSQTNICIGQAVQFTDNTNFATSWNWSFGDGGTSTQQNPTYTYNTGGNYTVTLTVGYNGCSDVTTSAVTVSAPVTGTFTGTPVSSCNLPLNVNFTANAPGNSGLQWTFGDGGTGTGSPVSHSYNTAGSYTVTLGIQNAQGCVYNVTQGNYINVGPPTASFSPDVTQGCAPLAVQFTNTSSSSAPITSYQWIFGDGATSTQQNPSHTYTTSNIYNPMLIISIGGGCSDTFVYQSINVGANLVASFSANPLVVCRNQPVIFTSTTAGAGATAVYTWDFGDGGTSGGPNPSYQYDEPGTYDITMTVNVNGCIDDTLMPALIIVNPPKADFNTSFDCFNSASVQFTDTSTGANTWAWDFGDGSGSSLQNPSHVYATQGTFDVTLVVTNSASGCIDSITKQVNLGPPSAGFTADSTVGCRPFSVQFSDTSTSASSWAWDFGDGSGISTVQSPTHVYQDTGRYTVTLVINPGDPCADSITFTNYITVWGSYPDFVGAPLQGCVPFPVNFTGSAVLPQGSTVTAWKYFFGDGDSAMLQNPTHIYTAAAPYTVRLLVTDNYGCTNSRQRGNYVIGRTLNAEFTYDSIICPGEVDSFRNASFPGNSTCQWDFGDGTTATVANPVKVYTTAGTYTVRLIATNTTGCIDTIYKTVRVDAPEADFTVASNFATCPPFPAQFTNTSNRPDLPVIWYFGDGDTSSNPNPTHFYFFPGQYDVTLLVYDPISGCFDSTSYVNFITINGPTGTFSVTPGQGCVPLDIQTTGTIFSAASYILDLGDGTVLNNTTNVSHTYTSPNNYAVTFTLTDTNGCIVPYPVDTVQVGIIPFPGLPTDTSVCRGNYVQFNLPFGDTFVWTVTDLGTGNPCTNCLSCYNCINPLFTGLDTALVSVTATTSLGCTATDAITIYVDALPQINPGIAYNICNGESIQLNAGNNVAAAVWSGTLQFPNDIQYLDDTLSVTPTVTPTGLTAPDTLRFRVTGTNTLGCAISRLVQVMLIDEVLITFNTTDTIICEGGSVPLSITVNQASWNDTVFTWTPQQYLNSAGAEDPIATPPVGDYSYTVIVSSPGCASATGSVNISVKDQPELEAGDDQTVTPGTQIQLYASSTETLAYTWTTMFSDSLDCYNCRRPFISPNQSQVVYVSATNEFGCTTIDSVILKVVSCDPESVFLPNTFTPNDDGLNDVFRVRGIGLTEVDYFNVFDRWGRMVFTTKDINQGWDGIIGSRKGEEGTYVYIMKATCTNGQTVEKSGNVTLIK